MTPISLKFCELGEDRFLGGGEHLYELTHAGQKHVEMDLEIMWVFFGGPVITLTKSSPPLSLTANAATRSRTRTTSSTCSISTPGYNG